MLNVDLQWAHPGAFSGESSCRLAQEDVLMAMTQQNVSDLVSTLDRSWQGLLDAATTVGLIPTKHPTLGNHPEEQLPFQCLSCPPLAADLLLFMPPHLAMQLVEHSWAAPSNHLRPPPPVHQTLPHLAHTGTTTTGTRKSPGPSQPTQQLTRPSQAFLPNPTVLPTSAPPANTSHTFPPTTAAAPTHTAPQPHGPLQPQLPVSTQSTQATQVPQTIISPHVSTAPLTTNTASPASHTTTTAMPTTTQARAVQHRLAGKRPSDTQFAGSPPHKSLKASPLVHRSSGPTQGDGKRVPNVPKVQHSLPQHAAAAGVTAGVTASSQSGSHVLPDDVDLDDVPLAMRMGHASGRELNVEDLPLAIRLRLMRVQHGQQKGSGRKGSMQPGHVPKQPDHAPMQPDHAPMQPDHVPMQPDHVLMQQQPEQPEQQEQQQVEQQQLQQVAQEQQGDEVMEQRQPEQACVVAGQPLQQEDQPELHQQHPTQLDSVQMEPSHVDAARAQMLPQQGTQERPSALSEAGGHQQPPQLPSETHNQQPPQLPSEEQQGRQEMPSNRPTAHQLSQQQQDKGREELSPQLAAQQLQHEQSAQQLQHVQEALAHGQGQQQGHQEEQSPAVQQQPGGQDQPLSVHEQTQQQQEQQQEQQQTQQEQPQPSKRTDGLKERRWRPTIPQHVRAHTHASQRATAQSDDLTAQPSGEAQLSGTQVMGAQLSVVPELQFDPQPQPPQRQPPQPPQSGVTERVPTNELAQSPPQQHQPCADTHVQPLPPDIHVHVHVHQQSDPSTPIPDDLPTMPTTTTTTQGASRIPSPSPLKPPSDPAHHKPSPPNPHDTQHVAPHPSHIETQQVLEPHSVIPPPAPPLAHSYTPSTQGNPASPPSASTFVPSNNYNHNNSNTSSPPAPSSPTDMSTAPAVFAIPPTTVTSSPPPEPTHAAPSSAFPTPTIPTAFNHLLVTSQSAAVVDVDQRVAARLAEHKARQVAEHEEAERRESVRVSVRQELELRYGKYLNNSNNSNNKLGPAHNLARFLIAINISVDDYTPHHTPWIRLSASSLAPALRKALRAAKVAFHPDKLQQFMKDASAYVRECSAKVEELRLLRDALNALAAGGAASGAHSMGRAATSSRCDGAGTSAGDGKSRGSLLRRAHVSASSGGMGVDVGAAAGVSVGEGTDGTSGEFQGGTQATATQSHLTSGGGGGEAGRSAAVVSLDSAGGSGPAHGVAVRRAVHAQGSVRRGHALHGEVEAAEKALEVAKTKERKAMQKVIWSEEVSKILNAFQVPQ